MNTRKKYDDDGSRYYEEQKQRAVNAVIKKLAGDPRDPITRKLRRMAGLDKTGKGDSAADHKPTGGDA